MLRTKSSQAWYLFSNQVMQVNYLIGMSIKRDFDAVETSNILPAFGAKKFSSFRRFKRLVATTNVDRIDFKDLFIMAFF